MHVVKITNLSVRVDDEGNLLIENALSGVPMETVDSYSLKIADDGTILIRLHDANGNVLKAQS